MSDPVQSFFDILEKFELSLSGIDRSFEQGKMSIVLREQLKSEVKRQFEEEKAQLSASLPPVAGHSGALDAGHATSTPSHLPPASTAAPASDAHLGATSSVPKTGSGARLDPSAATTPVAIAPVVTTHVATTPVATTPVAPGRSVSKKNPVTPDVDHSPRPKRARTVPRDVEALVRAETILIERFKWKRILQLHQGPKYKYVNPQGNYNNKTVKTEDLKLGEDFFFDVQEALKYAEGHQG